MSHPWPGGSAPSCCGGNPVLSSPSPEAGSRDFVALSGAGEVSEDVEVQVSPCPSLVQLRFYCHASSLAPAALYPVLQRCTQAHTWDQHQGAAKERKCMQTISRRTCAPETGLRYISLGLGKGTLYFKGTNLFPGSSGAFGESFPIQFFS